MEGYADATNAQTALHVLHHHHPARCSYIYEYSYITRPSKHGNISYNQTQGSFHLPSLGQERGEPHGLNWIGVLLVEPLSSDALAKLSEDRGFLVCLGSVTSCKVWGCRVLSHSGRVEYTRVVTARLQQHQQPDVSMFNIKYHCWKRGRSPQKCHFSPHNSWHACAYGKRLAACCNLACAPPAPFSPQSQLWARYNKMIRREGISTLGTTQPLLTHKNSSPVAVLLLGCVNNNNASPHRMSARAFAFAFAVIVDRPSGPTL